MLRKIFGILALGLWGLCLCQPVAEAAANYNFGDFTSSTITTKAWQALNAGDNKGAVIYARKCIELYEEDAKKMQASLDDYPKGTNQEIHNFWALNDVATSYFIMGKAFLNLNETQEAEKAFTAVVEEFTYGQCWDPRKWFWKPAEAAQQELDKLKAEKSKEAEE